MIWQAELTASKPSSARPEPTEGRGRSQPVESIVSACLWQVGRGAGWLLFGVAIAKLFNYGFKVIVARLGAETFGILTLTLMTLTVTAWLTSDELGGSMIRYVPFYRGKGDTARLRGTVLLGVGANATLAVIGGVVLYLIAPWLATRVFHHEQLIPLIRVMAVVLPLFNVRAVLLRVLLGFGRTDYHVYASNLCENIVTCFLAIILIVIGWGIWGAIIGYVTGLVLSFLIALWFLEIRTFSVFRSKTKPILEGAELFRYSLPLFLSGYVDVVQAWAAVALLGYFWNAEAVGLYGAGLLLASVVASVPDVFLPVSFPVVTQQYAQQRLAEAAQVADTVVKWIFALTVPLAVVLGILAAPLIRLLFGDEYASAVNVVYLLLAGNLWFALSTSGTAVLNMVKQTRLAFLLTAASTVLLVGSGLWLIPRLGAIGAGVATCVALGVHALATLGFARRHFSGGVIPQAGLSMALAAVTPLAVGVIVLPNGLQHAGEFVLAALAYLASYVGLLFALRVFTADDLAMLQGLIRVPSRAQQ